jgi:hypothetical protein
MRFGGIVLAVLLTLGACSSDPQPKEPKRTTTSATPTATPPTMPAQAKEDTPEGAAAFVKHYIDVFNYAASTGDVEELSRLSSPDCEGCQSYIKLYRDTYKAGGYFKDEGWDTVRSRAARAANGYTVGLDVRAPQTQYKTDGRSPVKIGEAGEYSLTLTVSNGRITQFATRTTS